MANLLSQNIGTNYKGILNLDATTINTPLDATLRAVTDGMGTSSLLQLSTEAVGLSRTVNLSAGATTPRLFNVAYTINNSGAQTGTLTGLFLNATETALNGITHNLMDLQKGGVSQFRLNNIAEIFLALNGGIKINNSRIATNNGSIFLGDVDNGTASNVTYRSLGLDTLVMSGALLKLGGTTASFPAIKRNGAAIDFRLADDSGACAVNAATITGSNLVATANIQIGNILYGNNFWQQSDGGTTIGAQAVPTTSSILDVKSTTKGFLPPRMTTTQKNAIATPATGLVVFDTTLAKLAVYTGAAWETVTSV